MDFKKLEYFIFEKMSDMNTAGISMALVEDDEVVWSRGFGFRSVAKRLPATPGTVYDVASVTKSFTAVAILQLQEQGKLSLEDPVAKFIPEFHIKPFGETIKLKHLLTHTSGLPGLGSSTRMKSVIGTRKDLMPLVTVEDYLLFLKDAQHWAVAKPGERYLYSNEGYALLSKVIQECSGTRFEDYIKAYILTPLGMTRSYFSRADVEADHDAATLYALVEGRLVPKPYLYTHVNSFTGLVTNVLDLTKYVSMLINRGTYQGNRVLSPQSVEAMITSHISTRGQLDSDVSNGYGYGLDIIPGFLGHTLAGHGGWIDISTAYMGFLPEKRIGVAVLANGAAYVPNFIAMYGLAMMLGEDPNALLFIERDRMLNELTGTYHTYMNTIGAQVSQIGGSLMLELRYENHRGVILPLTPDTLTEKRRLFFTMSLTSRVTVEFTVEKGRVELVYERFLFRKTLPA